MTLLCCFSSRILLFLFIGGFMVEGLQLQLSASLERLETFSLHSLRLLLQSSLGCPTNYPKLSVLLQAGNFGLRRMLEASCLSWDREQFLMVRNFVAASPSLQLQWLSQRCAADLRARGIVQGADFEGMLPSIPSKVEVHDVPRFLEAAGRVSRNDPVGYWTLQPCQLTPQAFDWLLAHNDGASIPSAVFKHLIGNFIGRTTDAPGAACAIAEYVDEQMAADPEAIFAAIQSLLALASRKHQGNWMLPGLGDLDRLTSHGVIRYILRKAGPLQEHRRAFQLIRWLCDADLSAPPRFAAANNAPPRLYPKASLAELTLYALIVLPSSLSPSQSATAVANVQVAMLQLGDPALARMTWELTHLSFMRRQVRAVFEEPQLQERLLAIGVPVRHCMCNALPFATRLRFFRRWLRWARHPLLGVTLDALTPEEELPGVIQNEHFNFFLIPPPRLLGQRTKDVLSRLVEEGLAKAQGIVAKDYTLELRDRKLFQQDIDGLVVDAALLLILHYDVSLPWGLSDTLLRSLGDLYDARLWPARHAIISEIW